MIKSTDILQISKYLSIQSQRKQKILGDPTFFAQNYYNCNKRIDIIQILCIAKNQHNLNKAPLD